MNLQTEVVVVGGGVFGLAAALELARRGRAVTVVDRLGSGHPATSSTGASRSIRTAYNEPFYVQLAQSALDGWARLEHETGETILHLTGQVDIGPAGVIDVLVAAAAEAGAPLAQRTNRELRELLPELSEAAGDGLFHQEAGTVMADAGMRALQAAALAAGVDISSPERTLEIDPQPQGATVRTDRREIAADHVVVAAGPWSGALLQQLGLELPLAPAVAQVTFLQAPGMVDRPGIAEWPHPGDVGVYGHPVPGIGYKIAFDAGAAGWRPDAEEWTPDPEEERRILEWMQRHLPGAPRVVAYSQRHPWTLTPDSDFVVDRRGSLVLACGCSGHAFKFGPALGPLVADVLDGIPAHSLFTLDRPGLDATVSPLDAIGR